MSARAYFPKPRKTILVAEASATSGLCSYARGAWRGSTSLPHTSPDASSTDSARRSSPAGSPRSDRRWTPSSRSSRRSSRCPTRWRCRAARAALHLALVVLGIARGDEVACASFTFSSSANAIVYTGADAGLRGFRRHVDDRPRAARERARRTSEDPRSRRGRPVRPVLRLRRARGRLRAARHPDRAGRCRVARVDLPRRARRRSGALAVVLVQRQQGDHDERRRDARLARRATGSPTRASSRRRRASRRRTTSTPRSASTTGSATCSPRSAAPSSRSLPERVAARRRVNDRYRELLATAPGISFMPEADYGRWQLLADLHRRRPRRGRDDRERIRLALEAEDIESRPLWKPMHLQPVFRGAPMVGGDVSAGLFEHGLCLPSGSALAETDQERVVEILLLRRLRTETKSSQSASARSCRARRPSTPAGARG